MKSNLPRPTAVWSDLRASELQRLPVAADRRPHDLGVRPQRRRPVLQRAAVRAHRGVHHLLVSLQRLRGVYPGRTSPFWAVKRPVRPYKSAIQNQFTTENAKAA